MVWHRVAWRAWVHWVCCAFVASLGVSACGEEGSEDGGGAPLDWCNAMNSWNRRCGFDSWDSDQACVSQNTAYFSHVHALFLRRMAGCIGASSCQQSFATVQKACAKKVTAELEPTSASDGFCDVLAPKLFDCGYTADKTSCAAGYAWANEILLERAKPCASRPCDELDQCMDQAFGTGN